MWRFEIEVQTHNPEVRGRVADDLAAWEQLPDISLSVARTEIGPRRTERVRSDSLSSVTLRAAPGRPVAQPRRRRPEPLYATLGELPSLVAFPVFALAGLHLPHTRAIITRDSAYADAATLVTIAYPVMDGDWHAGNVWLKLSDRPFPDSPTELWTHEAGLDVSEDHTEASYRYKVRLERNGTHIHLESSVHGSLDDVLALVERLEGVSM